MVKKNINKISIISAITVIILVGVGFGTYQYNKVQAYNNLITTANKYMDQGEYDKAITLLEQSLQYKKDSSIEKNIKLAQNLKEAKAYYDNGVKLMNDKKYLEAMEQFKKITKEDDKLYSNSQKKIEECKKQYIAQNLEAANTASKNSKYDDANKYLDNILKIDTNNADAKNLKASIDKTVKEQEENAKKVEEQANQNKIKENSNNQASNIQNNNNKTNNVQNNSQYNEYMAKIRKLDAEIKVWDEKKEHYPDYSQEYINCLQQQANLLKQEQDLTIQMQK
jgi:hypothetical protein